MSKQNNKTVLLEGTQYTNSSQLFAKVFNFSDNFFSFQLALVFVLIIFVFFYLLPRFKALSTIYLLYWMNVILEKFVQGQQFLVSV